MPLGLAKDSMLNLAEMASQKENDSDHNVVDPAIANLENGKGVVPIVDVVDDGDEGNDNQDSSVVSSVDASTNDDFTEGATATISTASVPTSAEASPQLLSAKSSDPTTSSYGQYSGFSSDYDDYERYGYTAYATNATTNANKGSSIIPSLLGGNNSKSDPNKFWCCIFPWMSKEADLDEGGEEAKEIQPASQSQDIVEKTPEVLTSIDTAGSSSSVARSNDQDDEVSTGSDVFGEKLSDKEKQAVLARLRLAQPDHLAPSNAAEAASEAEQQQQSMNGTNQNKILRGILRQKSTISRQNSLLQAQSASENGDGGKNRRRALFPQYDTSSKKQSKNLSVSFAPMARVVAVKSKNDMEEGEKGDIWWQKSDYEEFRKTGRMITRAMLDGGSEIWLASSESWRLPNQNKASTLKHALALSERQKHGVNSENGKKTKEEYEAARDKWWHAFGHSRRGLEHVASIDEGRQRQTNVRAAIRAVVEEQRRQKIFHREDADKLRMVSIQHSSWARDLALASGASDADAVRANFDDGSRKSREFYLLKFSRTNTHSSASAGEATRKNIPAFMKPILSMSPAAGNRLDANTTSQIRYRKTVLQNNAKKTSTPKSATSTTSASSLVETPIKDDASTSSSIVGGKGGDSMAKRAAGFASGDDVANMSAVLTGMGPIPKTTATVGGP